MTNQPHHEKIENLFEMIASGNCAEVRNRLEKNGDLLKTRSQISETPLICAAREGKTEIVKYLLEIGADPDAATFKGEIGAAICWAARFGRADIVDTLISSGANRQIALGPGHWAYSSPIGKQNDILAVTRAQKELEEIWQSGGLPVGRWDSFTMTEMKVKEKKAIHIAVLSDHIDAGGQRLDGFHEKFGAAFAAAIKSGRKIGFGCPYFVFDSFEKGAGSGYFDEGAVYTSHMGIETANYSEVEAEEAATLTIPGARWASVFVRGSYSQLGYAHYELRRFMKAAGIDDKGIRSLEICHYFEDQKSDMNITELAVEVK